MSSRIHQIQLPDDLERRLLDRAAEAGTDAETFILRVVEEKLQSPKSFREIFAPLQEAFADGDMSPEATDELFKQLRQRA